MRPKVLLVCEKYTRPLDPSCRIITGADHALAGSLISSDMADVQVCYWDELFHTTGITGDQYAIGYCEKNPVDLVVISCLVENIFNVRRLMQWLRQRNIPIVYIWWDHCSAHNRALAEQFCQWTTLNVVMDNSELLPTAYPEKFVCLWNSHDTRLFYDAGMDRDIDVTFLGISPPSFTERHRYLGVLAQNGIPVYRKYGLINPDHVPIEEFARTYQRTKIALSFTWHPDMNCHQAKGRTYEVLRCGAMLLETENPHSRRRFIPHEEYVPFDGEQDLLDKVRYYLSHDEERRLIAQRGYKKVTENYSNKVFWGIVFKRSLPNLRLL